MSQKILFLVPRYHSNLIGLVDGLCKSGLNVSFLVCGQGATEAHGDVRVKVIQPASMQPFLANKFATVDFALYSIRMFPNLRALYRDLIDEAPTFVVCRGLSPIYIICAMPYIVCRSKIILYTQGPLERKWSVRRYILNTLLLAICRGRWFSPVERVGFPNPSSWRDERIKFIPFAMDVNSSSRSRKWSTNRTKLLAVGKFEMRKNHNLLIDAMINADEGTSATIVGEMTTDAHKSYYTQLKSRIEQLGLGDRIDVHCNVPHAAMSEIYLSHDIYVQLSQSEPASVSQLEAMSHGMGVIISADNGTATYVQDGINGRIISAALEEFSYVLRKIEEDRDIAQRWGKESLALTAAEFSSDIVAAKFTEILRR